MIEKQIQERAIPQPEDADMSFIDIFAATSNGSPTHRLTDGGQ
jgi:hypothetical protein